MSHAIKFGRRGLLNAAVAGLVGIGLGVSVSVSRAEWPEKPVTIIVPAGAGGGTDATARLLAQRLEAKFKQPFNVVNVGEGGGLVGISRIVAARPDGYTLGVLFNYAHYKELGQADITAAGFTPIAQYNFDPASLNVRADGAFKTAADLIGAIKDNPGKFNISCGGGCGGSWALAFAGLLSSRGIAVEKLQMIPAQGAAAGMLELAAGTLDVVPCSLPEAASMISAGKARPLAVLAKTRNSAFPDVPTIKEAIGVDFAAGAWRGVVGPAKLPAEINARIEAALKEIVADAGFVKAMQERGFGVEWRSGAELGAFMKAHETDVGVLMKALGLAKK